MSPHQSQNSRDDRVQKMLEIPLEPFILGVNAHVVDNIESPVGICNANNTVKPCHLTCLAGPPVGWSPSMVGGHSLNSPATQEVFPAFRPLP